MWCLTVFVFYFSLFYFIFLYFFFYSNALSPSRYTSRILIAVNPYAKIEGLYGEQAMAKVGW